MNPPLTNSNGRKQRPPDPLDLLASLNANENSYRRISVNSSWTYRNTTGKHDLALTLWDKCQAGWEHSKCEAPDIDAISAQAIQQSVQQRLQSLAEITDGDESNLERQQQLLRELASREQTKHVRQVRDAVVQTITDAVTPLRAALQDLVNRSPFMCLEVIDSLQKTLHDVQYPVPDFTPQKRLTHGMRALGVIGRAPGMQSRMRERLAGALRKQCLAEFHTAIEAVVLDYIGENLHQAVADLLPHLDELRTQQALFRRNVAAVRKLLDDERTQARQRSVTSRSSVVLEMDTPDETQLLSGLRDLHRCPDQAALVLLFADKLQLALNETARQRYPFVRTPAPLTEVVTRLPPAAVAATVAEVVTDMLGDLHTVYTAVRSFGVRRAVQELFDRAAPLCSLTSRDHIRLQVEPHRDVLVRFPRPRGAEDGEIAEQVREGFRKLHPVCQFLEDPLEMEISVVRTLVGFPIAIEATNVTLLYYYAASAEQGHRPHLYGFLPDSPDGRHLPQLLALAQHMFQPSETP